MQRHLSPGSVRKNRLTVVNLSLRLRKYFDAFSSEREICCEEPSCSSILFVTENDQPFVSTLLNQEGKLSVIYGTVAQQQEEVNCVSVRVSRYITHVTATLKFVWRHTTRRQQAWQM